MPSSFITLRSKGATGRLEGLASGGGLAAPPSTTQDRTAGTQPAEQAARRFVQLDPLPLQSKERLPRLPHGQKCLQQKCCPNVLDAAQRGPSPVHHRQRDLYQLLAEAAAGRKHGAQHLLQGVVAEGGGRGLQRHGWWSAGYGMLPSCPQGWSGGCSSVCPPS